MFREFINDKMLFASKTRLKNVNCDLIYRIKSRQNKVRIIPYRH